MITESHFKLSFYVSKMSAVMNASHRGDIKLIFHRHALQQAYKHTHTAIDTLQMALTALLSDYWCMSRPTAAHMNIK